MLSPRLLRTYSTRKAASKLWVKNNGAPATKVTIKGCNNVDDVIKSWYVTQETLSWRRDMLKLNLCQTLS